MQDHLCSRIDQTVGKLPIISHPHPTPKTPHIRSTSRQPQRIIRSPLPPTRTPLLPSPSNDLLPSIAITARPQRILRRLRSRPRSFGRILDAVAVVRGSATGAVGCVCYTVGEVSC